MTQHTFRRRPKVEVCLTDVISCHGLLPHHLSMPFMMLGRYSTAKPGGMTLVSHSFLAKALARVIALMRSAFLMATSNTISCYIR